MRGAVRQRSRFVFFTGISVALATVSLLVAFAGSGEAAYPGTNGKIAFVAEGHQIFSANADGSGRTALNSPPEHVQNFQPAYSPDGSRIAFMQYADTGESGLWVMNADGSEPIRLRTSTSTRVAEPVTWEENYETSSEPPMTIPEVKIEVFVTEQDEVDHPSFSPDGSQLALGQESGTYIQTEVCAVEVEGETGCIPSGDSGFYESTEYECEECGSHIITVSASTGATTREVTAPSSTWEDYDPSYSFGGAIAFAREDSTRHSSIYVAPSGGGSPVQVSDGPSDYEPSFSPDGSRIVFATESEELGVVSSGGGLVTSIPVTAPAAGHEVGLASPTFSPDGTQIAFRLYVRSGSGEEDGIYTVTSSGAGQKEIIPSGEEPTWQPIPIPAEATPISSPAPSPVTPVTSHPTKGKVKLSKSGVGTIGTVACGSTACKLKVLSASLKVGKKKCAAKVTAPGSLAAGKTGKVTVAVKGKCLASLKKAGKGKLSTKLSVTDSAGSKTLTFNATLTPKATKPKHKK
jgi:Tol biopolymer transport system component